MIGTLRRWLKGPPKMPTLTEAIEDGGGKLVNSGPGALAIVAHQDGQEAHIVIKNDKAMLAIPLDDAEIANLITALEKLQEVRREHG